MCGIVGVVGSKNSLAIILDGLKKLEYRGYDSAGIALIENGQFQTVKEEGKIAKLEAALEQKNLIVRHLTKPASAERFESGAERRCEVYKDIHRASSNAPTAKSPAEVGFCAMSAGIGHTRWATHGRPSQENAHPHASSKVCVVHNGIVENHQQLREKLQKSGVKFLSQTDSEVLPHLIEYHFEKNKDIKQSLLAVAQEIRGTFAFAAIFKDHEDVIALAKRGSPLVIGLGENENYIASDYYGLSAYTNKIITLEDEEFALVSSKKIEIFDNSGKELKKSPKLMEVESGLVSKGGYEHFMLKEIYEQPRVLEETIQTYLDLSSSSVHLPNFTFDLKKINKITIIACGTSYYAGLCAKYLIEEIADLEVEVDIASEFRYRAHPFRADNLMIFISQSGETADSLAALKFAKKNGQKTLSIVNVAHSGMAQLSDVVIRTVAGLEIGVASTKAYTAQIAVLSLLAIHLAWLRGKISAAEKTKLLQEFAESGAKMAQILAAESVENIKKIARTLTGTRHALYIGRGISQITAFEAALKLRELSYINAQGIAAGELKHGTIALIDKKMPVVVVAPRREGSDIFEKTSSNAEEVNARGGKIIFISDSKGIAQFGKMAKQKIEIPEISGPIQEALLPVISTQLLAYYVALFKGNDVDQPRNLAKSVTVE